MPTRFAIFLALFACAATPCLGVQIKYQMQCSEGKGPTQTREANGSTVVLSAESGSCQITVFDSHRTSVFQYKSRWFIDAFVGTGVTENGKPNAIIQTPGASDKGYKLFVVSLGDQPHLITTIENQYGFWLQNDCGDVTRIWTSDGAFQNDPDLIDVYLYDVFTPPVVLGVRGGRLFDATPECKPYFDKVIANTRVKLSEQQIRTFRSGRTPKEAAQGLVRGRILYIVFCYLYTDRENDAHQTVERMWPPQDAHRIWQSIIKRQAEGVLAQIGRTP